MIGHRGFWLGAVGSAAFLTVFILLFVDFDTIGDVLRSANYAYIAPALIFYFLAVHFRAVRWRFLLRPLMGRPQRAIYPVVVVGYMANNLIPVRIGEVLRSYYLSIREPVSAAGAFGTVAVERASDVLALLFFLGLAAFFLPVTGTLDDLAAQIPGGTTVLVLAALLPFLVVMGTVAFITALSPETVLRLVERLAFPVPEKFRLRLLSLVRRLLEGLTVVRSPRALLSVFILSLPVWTLEAAMYYTISFGFDLRSSFGSTAEFIAVILVFTAAANLAGVLPSSAGSWGPFDFFGTAALVALGAPFDVASVFALTVHVALWVPVTALGLAVLVMDGTSLRRLMRRAREDKQALVPRPSPGSNS